MWRIEVYHALSVHFPIVLLSLGTILFLLALWFRKKEKALFLLPASRLLLWLGVVSVWIAIYTGDQTEGAVARQICDPTILKQHEIHAYWVGYLFTAGILLEAFANFLKMQRTIMSRIMVTAICALFIAGTGYLIYVGHLGATLVYQQGAGVYHPSEDCHEFE